MTVCVCCRLLHPPSAASGWLLHCASADAGCGREHTRLPATTTGGYLLLLRPIGNVSNHSLSHSQPLQPLIQPLHPPTQLLHPLTQLLHPLSQPLYPLSQLSQVLELWFTVAAAAVKGFWMPPLLVASRAHELIQLLKHHTAQVDTCTGIYILH